MADSRFRALLLTLACLLLPAAASAANPAISVETAPVLGPGSSMNDGWTSFQVWLRNPGKSEVIGTVELVGSPAWSREQKRNLSTAPFALAPGARVALQLPAHGFTSTPTEFELRVLDQSRATLATAPLPELRQADPLLLDLSSPSRMAPGVRGLGLVVQLRSSPRFRTPSALVATPPTDPVTGDLILPRWSAGYASASLVAASGKRLATLGKLEQKALADWVLAGGSLAIAIERPEDLRLDLVTRLSGGAVKRGEPNRELLERATFYLPTDEPTAPTPSPTPSGGGSNPISVERLAPRADTASQLEGFSGGNLRTSPWGAVGSYGLGEVHLLAFDLSEPFATDRWAQLKLVDLLRHSWERQTPIALPLGGTGFDSYGANSIRNVLDPNRSVRWTIIAAALLLLVYAVVAGPFNFWLASKRGTPLKALWRVPLLAGVTLLSIVAIGLLGKGIRGRVQRLTLIESGAGMERAAATRFRGFYASSSREITVQPTSRGSLLEVATGDDFVDRTLVIDRDGPRLERLRTKPWATVVVREDGFASLAGGISIVREADGTTAIRNRTARALVAAVLKLPGKSALGFGRIRDGELVHERAGEVLSSAIAASTSYTPVHQLGAKLFTSDVDKHAEGLGEMWGAIEAQAGTEVDWWPNEVPVLIAQLDGGEGVTRDSGFEVTQDRVLVRVVGWGGVK
jgi:hypothetical protein